MDKISGPHSVLFKKSRIVSEGPFAPFLPPFIRRGLQSSFRRSSPPEKIRAILPLIVQDSQCNRDRTLIEPRLDNPIKIQSRFGPIEIHLSTAWMVYFYEFKCNIPSAHNTFQTKTKVTNTKHVFLCVYVFKNSRRSEFHQLQKCISCVTNRISQRYIRWN